MQTRKISFCISLLVLILSTSLHAQSYSWIDDYDDRKSIKTEISIPEGYSRIEAAENSFQDWLRNLPLNNEQDKVLLYNGVHKRNQKAHHAVIDIDIGDKNLQQCADAVIRLRAEYLYSLGRYDDISFNFTSGDKCEFRKWIEGYRPEVNNNNVSWHIKEPVDSTYSNFRDYLGTVFTYAGTYSLKKELKPVEDIDSIKIGDVFIEGGFPGHAVIVVDLAENRSGKRIFLLAQSFMPAQNLHILKNPDYPELTPWYSTDINTILVTPEWRFKKTDLMRFYD